MARTARRPWAFRPSVAALTLLPAGHVDITGHAEVLDDVIPDEWPEGLWICAARRNDGGRVVFGRTGSPPAPLARAVAASCAIPGYYAPVAVAGDDYVDGGAHSPTNADLAADGPGLVVVSSPMSVGRGALRPRAALVGRLTHRATLQREVAGLRRKGRSVVTFQPGAEDLAVMGGGANALDAGRRDRVARQARESTLRRLDGPRLREALAALH
jgi:NTE family protein